MRDSNDDAFEISLTVRARHGSLWKLACARGGVEALAAEIGVSQYTLRNWIAFRSVPACGVVDVRGRRRAVEGSPRYARISQAVCKLCELTGKTPEQLFPGFIRSRMSELQKPVTLIRTVELQQLSVNSRLCIDNGCDADPLQALEDDERKAAIEKLLKTLSHLEREIIKLRYGLGDGYSYTLEEVGHIFKVTRERIRQIEAKAIRRLQRPARIAELRNLVPECWGEDRARGGACHTAE